VVVNTHYSNSDSFYSAAFKTTTHSKLGYVKIYFQIAGKSILITPHTHCHYLT